MSAIETSRLVLPDEPGGRAQIWQRHSAPVFDVAFGRHSDLLKPMKLDTHLCGEMIFGVVDAPAQRLTRTARKVAHQGIDHVLIQFYEAGSSSVQARSTSAVRASQMVVFDMAQPVEAEVEAYSAINLIIPRKALADAFGSVEHLHGQTFDFAVDPIRRMLHNYFRDIISEIDRVEDFQAGALSEAAFALCRACLPRSDTTSTMAHATRRLAIRQHVEEALGSPDLSVKATAARFGLSGATLQRLFEQDGGFVSYVRERRLQRAFTSLVRAPGPFRPRLEEIADAIGFSDPATFARAFQHRFGFAPGDAREGPAACDGLRETDEILLSWMNRF